MKTSVLLIALFITVFAYSQELKENTDTKKFEYIEVVEQKRTVESFNSRLKSLGYKEIETSEYEVQGQGQINEKVMGFVVELFYDATIELKDEKYRIKITNVLVKDVKGTYILEDMGGYKKKWLKKFNKRLPEIVSQLKKENTPDKW